MSAWLTLVNCLAKNTSNSVSIVRKMHMNLGNNCLVLTYFTKIYILSIDLYI